MKRISRKHVRVLELINQARKALGYRPLKKLRKGIQGEPNACPLFHSIPYAKKVGELYIEMRSQESAKKIAGAWKDICVDGTVVLPGVLQGFISKFDDGKYPELVKK